MSEQAQAREAWLAGVASAADRARLDPDDAETVADLRLGIALQAAAPDRAAASWAALERSLAAVGPAAAERAVDRALPRPRRLARPVVLATAALLLLGVGLAFWWSQGAATTPAAVELVAVRGTVRCADQPGVAGSIWQPGTTVTCAAGAEAELRFADGSRLALLGATLRQDTGGGLHLTEGLLRATVAHRRAGQEPFAIGTPVGRATVLGTVFDLRADRSGGRLRVHQGRVAFARDEQRVVLSADRQLAIGADGRLVETALPALDPRFGGRFVPAAAERYATGGFLLDAARRDEELAVRQAGSGAALVDRGARRDVVTTPAETARILPDASGSARARLCVDPQGAERLRLRCRFRLLQVQGATRYEVRAGKRWRPATLPTDLEPLRRDLDVDDERWHDLTIDSLVVGRTRDGLPIRETLIRLDGQVLVQDWHADLGAVLAIHSLGNPIELGGLVVAAGEP